LENTHSEEVRKELPKDNERFVEIDKKVKNILKDGEIKKKTLTFNIQDNVMARLEEAHKQLTLCEKALNDFMDSNRKAFPIFYFVSQSDLLDILSNGNNTKNIIINMPKIFQVIKTLNLKDDSDRPHVDFSKQLKLIGKVENCL
jgi:dynein heavy chain